MSILVATLKNTYISRKNAKKTFEFFSLILVFCNVGFLRLLSCARRKGSSGKKNAFQGGKQERRVAQSLR